MAFMIAFTFVLHWKRPTEVLSGFFCGCIFTFWLAVMLWPYLIRK